MSSSAAGGASADGTKYTVVVFTSSRSGPGGGIDSEVFLTLRGSAGQSSASPHLLGGGPHLFDAGMPSTKFTVNETEDILDPQAITLWTSEAGWTPDYVRVIRGGMEWFFALGLTVLHTPLPRPSLSRSLTRHP